MNYLVDLKFHFKPKKGWMNDPNGLLYYNGYYHAFYQHSPNYESPFIEPMMWGHARTKDFLHWEELPVALIPEGDYEIDGCWSGTGIVKDDVFYLFYASVINKHNEEYGDYTKQTVSLATSTDGINFTKSEKNPLLSVVPEGNRETDFRDPAILEYKDEYYLAVAGCNTDRTKGRLLLFKSKNLIDWKYNGVLREYNDAIYCECPSFVKYGNDDKLLLATSICYKDYNSFELSIGKFDGDTFVPEITGNIQKGPDQYAGQIFRDDKGRCILITWVPGWKFTKFAERSIGCLSLPVEIKVVDGKIIGCPLDEVKHLLKDDDERIIRNEKGFTIKRTLRPDVVYEGEIRDLKVLVDEYLIEIFINNGEDIVIAVLC